MALSAFCCISATAQMQFPETPPPGQLVQDYAAIISEQDKETIRKIQYEAYEKFDTPIVVVTVNSLKEFNAGRQQIEKVAHDLFDHWQIGKRDENDKLINQGILLLVSVGDRKARIELGDDWGRNWDGRCDKIMKHSIVKQFKKGDYSVGIVAGVEKLAAMGKVGPSGFDIYSFADNFNEPINEISPIPKFWAYLMIGAGVLFILLSFAAPQFQTPLLIAGIGLILLAIFFTAVLWALLIIVGMLGKGSSGGGDWSGGGGFSSGGFSGGGGATGSW